MNEELTQPSNCPTPSTDDGAVQSKSGYANGWPLLPENHPDFRADGRRYNRDMDEDKLREILKRSRQILGVNPDGSLIIE